MDLFLALDVAVGTAGKLDVLLPPHHLPDRLGLRPTLMPHVDREDERITPRVVVEHRLDRRVGVQAAIPVRHAVDAHRRERRRQRARGHDMLDAEGLFTAVEVAHLAAAHVDRADRKARAFRVQQIEIDQPGQRLPQRLGAVVARLLHPQHSLHAAQCLQVGLEERRDAA